MTTGLVVIGALLLLLYGAYRYAAHVDRAWRAHVRDAADRDPVRCTCDARGPCDGVELDYDDYRDYALGGPMPRPLCLPCLYRSPGTRCFAAHLADWVRDDV